MENPEIVELLQLLLAREQHIDTQVQFWLTTSFATIVAAYAGRNTLSQKLRHIVTALYLLATLMFVSRWYYDVISIFSIVQQISEIRGQDTTESPPYVTIVSRVLLMISGTLATVYFIYNSAKENTEEGPRDGT